MLYYSGLSRTLRQLRWVLYPRRCPFCDRVLGNQPACPDCADGLAELRRAPSMRLRGSEHYLGRLDGAAAPYRYTGLVRRAVLRAKYQGAPWAAVELGVEMARLLFGSEIRMCGSEPLPEPVPGLDRGYDCILPVPASSKKRGYNVPERMAQPLARAVGVPVVTDALTRARSTRRQEGLSLDERLANVAGAFRVARPEAVEGKRILLVDDVLTTGKSEIQAKIKEMIMAQLEQQEIGLMLTNITKHLYSHRKFFIFCFHNSAASFLYILSNSVQSCTVILSCPEKILNVKYPKKRPFSDNKSYLRKVFFISDIFLF